MPNQAPEQSANLSCAVVACSLVLLALAAMMIFWGIMGGLSVRLITTGLVTAFLGAWLSLRTLISARRRDEHKRAALTASAAVGIVSLLVLVAGMMIVVALGRGRPFVASPQKFELIEPPQPQPGDDAKDVAPDSEIVIDIVGARFRSGQPILTLTAADHGGHAVDYLCDTVENDGTRTRCRPQVPLLFDTRYNATLRATGYGDRETSTATVTESWSITTASRYSACRGISPELIRIGIPTERGTTVEGKPGALPGKAFANGWQVFARDRGSLRQALAVRADGSFNGVLDTRRDGRQVRSRDFFLDITDAGGQPVVRLPLGPMVSEDGRTIRFVGKRPFRFLTPDGALVVFGGNAPETTVGSVSIHVVDGPCSHPLPPDLGCAGSWRVAYTLLSSGDTFPGRIRSMPSWFRKRPKVDVLYPAPDDIPKEALLFDATLGNVAVQNRPGKMFILKGIGRTVEMEQGRFFSFRERFPVIGGDDLEEIDPFKIYSGDLNGVHHLLYERSKTITLVVGNYSGRNWKGDWHVSEFDVVLDPKSRLNMAAPLPVYGAAVVARDDVTLAILPVITEQQFILQSVDVTTGWVGAIVHFEAVRRRFGAAQFIGDLDELHAVEFARVMTDEVNLRKGAWHGHQEQS